jgi:UDP-N-acetylmuramate: L-alanyl-gamma-D-glutamyl-meso-diaminopimelate ligase
MDSWGIEKSKLIGSLEKFRGVKRRMEFVGEVKGILIYDDFAHHPTAVGYAIDAMRERYPGKRLWAVFQPRSNTSVTNVFQDEWVNAFSRADCAVIADLHRKEKIPEAKRLSRKMLKETLEQKSISTFLWNDASEIADKIVHLLKDGDIVLIMSNSDFDGLPLKILNHLKQNN